MGMQSNPRFFIGGGGITMFKSAVIGVGSMGRHHARVYSELEETELLAVSDVDEKQGKQISEKHGCKFYTDYKQLILTEKPEVISIATPTVYHEEVALFALEHGAHILVEKPIAHNMQAAKRIAEKAHEKGLKLMVGHIERFNPATQELKRQLNTKKIGDIVSMSARRVGPFTNRISDVGVILDVGVHDIDLMSYLIDDAVSGAFATAGDAHGLSETYAQLMLKFNNGGSGIIEVNRLSPNKAREITVTGTKGVAYADFMNQTVTVVNGKTDNPEITKVEPLKAEIAHFIECISLDKRPLVNGVEGMHALEVALTSMDAYKHNRFEKIRNGYQANQSGLELEINIGT